MSEANNIIEKSWYQQFWPWFLITLPASAVIACMVTLTIAINKPSSLVVDDYSRIGFATKKNSERLDNALKLGIQARLQLNRREGLVTVFIEQLDETPLQSLPDTLQLLLLHPALESRDHALVLTRNAADLYQGSASQKIEGRFYVQLESEKSEWRLNGELLASDDHLVLGAESVPVTEPQ